MRRQRCAESLLAHELFPDVAVTDDLVAQDSPCMGPSGSMMAAVRTGLELA